MILIRYHSVQSQPRHTTESANFKSKPPYFGGLFIILLPKLAQQLVDTAVHGVLSFGSQGLLFLLRVQVGRMMAYASCARGPELMLQ